MTATESNRHDDSFLAPPGEVADWRAVLLRAAAEEHGLLAQLPGTAEDVAAGAGRDPLATRVVLDALVAVASLSRDDHGRYGVGTATDDPSAAVVAHHARAIRQWADGLDPRLRGESPTQRRRRTGEELARWYDALATNARDQAPALVDACLDVVVEPRAVLDVGGGHGEYAAEFARRGAAVTLQDLPDAIEAVRDRPAIADHGVELIAADVFDGVAEGPFDLVLCAGVTHIFDAERNAALARSLAGAVRPGGAVAIHTFLRDLDPLAPLFAVQMLVVGNGDTHGLADYEQWYTAAGFAPAIVVEVGDGGRRLLVFARPV